ncbi:single-stranded DNA-binding protein [Actinoplanes sp. LDG1-06]|uniref:Single-stranded DNA-binding protein n=1 Tax=Paractinoplanes ovalisporus TaxID=2810368 RepID=A0ABS2AVL2_9ACTN|nr:single-stranded DNA-binding protein [Actinoplanes ovalisporus]MBM2623408.1 single-stranded DNA-binding protein [Actinoplanes ovalisporus]
MSEFNLTFEGNLAAKPELEETKTGQTLCRLRVAHNRRRKVDGEWVDTTPMWVQVTAWGDLAERCAELNKGDTVTVRARDDLGVWPFVRQDGTPGGVLEVSAENVSLSMRFKGARPADDAKAEGDPWDPTTAELEPELQPA